MKKSFLFSLAFSVFGIGMLALSASAVEVTTTDALIQPRTTSVAIADGELIKGESYKTVYYLAEDGKRYVFPNSKTYFSWYDDFSNVREVTDEELFGYPLGGNVRYKPGSLLVKITTDPKVYAVGENGRLRWVKSEKAAKALYGDHWNKLVDDVPDAFFTNYELGDDINGEEDFNPSEVEEEYPSISHSRGFKAREIVQNKIQDRVERRCGILEEAVNKLQKRVEKYGIEIEGLGEDFLGECVEGGMRHMDKVQVCRLSEDGNYKTLNVASNALRGLLAKRATLGACDDSLLKDNTEGNEEMGLECAEGEEVQQVDGVDTCVVVEEETVECVEGEELMQVDGVDTCVLVDDSTDNTDSTATGTDETI